MKLYFTLIICLILAVSLSAQENGGPYTPDENTVLLMHFDGNITNSAYNAFTLLESEVGTYIDDPIPELGKAYRINNTPNSEGWHCLYAPHNNILNFEGSFTIETWVKTGDLGNEKTEYPFLIDKSQSFGLSVDVNGNGFRGYVKFENDTDIDFYQNQMLEEGKWYHVAMVSDTAAKTVSFYVHDEQKRPVFTDTRSFPPGSNGKIRHSDAELFVGGVDGDSNIQFDGWFDELRISTHAADYSEMYTSDSPFIKVGETKHFEFYTNISEEEEFCLQIKDELEKEYAKLSSLWNRPRKDSIFPIDSKITIKYSHREDIFLINEYTPSWKCGFHSLSNNEIYLSPIKTELQSDYYNNLAGLVVNEFSQYAVSKRRIIRDHNTNFPAYFLEGFGLFEAGFRPRIDSIKAYMEGLENPEISFIQDTSGIVTTLKKDVTVSLIEGQIVSGWSYDEVNPGAASFIESDWPRYIRGYFLIDENRRFRCVGFTEHFFAYSASSDSVYALQCIDSLEILLARYSELYELEINHPWAFTFFHDEEAAVEIGGYIKNSGSGGAGYGGSGLTVLLSPDVNGNILKDWWNYGVLKHEFFHTVSNHFNMFSFFYNEGLTTYMANAPTRKDELNLYTQRLLDVLAYYENTYGRPPLMDEFVWDPHRGVDGFRGIDPYFFGAAFFHFIFQTYNYVDVKNFIVGEGDFEGALHKSEKEIESGYLAYLDSLLHPVFEPDTLDIPFFDDFDDDPNTFRNWNRANVLGQESWHIFDQGSDGTLCARIYVNESPYVEDDWLFSGLFNATEAENVKVSFSYYYWGDNFTPKFYYTTTFRGKIEDTEWVRIEDIPTIQEWTWNNIELTLPSSGNELVFAFRYQAAIGDFNKVMIDNFSVEAVKKTIPIVSTQLATNITSTSVTLNGAITDNGGSTITQRGFYWSASNSNPGSSDHKEIVSGTTGDFSYDLTGLSPSTTYYYCAFATNSEGTSTGDVLQFTTETQLNPPVCETATATEITTSSAQLNGSVSSDGGATITQCGFYWSSSNNNPGSSDHIVTVSGTTGQFEYELTGLSPSTTYYYCAFATNSEGTSVGEVMSFTTIEDKVLMPLPFYDDFNADIDDWFLQNTVASDQWYWNNEEGYNGSNSSSFTLNLQKPYDVNDAWFISPEIDTKESSNVEVKFKYMRWGDYLSPRLYYTNYFTGDVVTTSWTEINDIYWGEDVLQYYDIEPIVVETPETSFWFAFRYETTADIAAAFYIDNFSVEDKITGVRNYSKQELSVYPNPVTNKTQIVFHLNKPDVVTFEVYNLKGGTQFIIPDSRCREGLNHLPIGKYISESGIYIGKLISSEWVCNIKLVVP